MVVLAPLPGAVGLRDDVRFKQLDCACRG